jgi:hypothetical protein
MLVEAVDEIVKTWTVTNEAFGSVWRLFNPKADLYDATDYLLAINDHALARQVENGRVHYVSTTNEPTTLLLDPLPAGLYRVKLSAGDAGSADPVHDVFAVV